MREDGSVREHTGSDRESTRVFFGARAAGWERKFPDDGPAFVRAVAELGLSAGDFVLDAGCGSLFLCETNGR